MNDFEILLCFCATLAEMVEVGIKKIGKEKNG
jgi:hypothetical protein